MKRSTAGLTLAMTALATLGLTTAGAFATEIESLTDAERAAFRAEVRAYLLDNPEVLQEAIAVLEQREAEARVAADAALVAANAEMLRNDPTSWVGGNPDGDVTLIEFVDYRCGYCRRAYEEVEALVENDGNIRFVLKEFPILGPQSLISAQLALAVRALGGDAAYKTAHDLLITWPGDIDDGAIDQIAGIVDIDPAALRAAMDGQAVNAIIEANHALALRLQITGTPTFVLEGEMVRGFMPRSSMEALVARARDDAANDG